MNNTIIIGAIVVVVLVVVGALFLMGGTGASHATTQSYSTAQTTAPATQNSQATTTASTNMTNTSGSTSYTVLLMTLTKSENYLTNSTGFTLYTYASDSPNSGTSACYSSCATNWPPFYAGAIVVPQGLNASLFKTIRRTDGTMQTTYKGYPLYFFIGDSKAGDMNGNNQGGFIVAVR